MMDTKEILHVFLSESRVILKTAKTELIRRQHVPDCRGVLSAAEICMLRS